MKTKNNQPSSFDVSVFLEDLIFQLGVPDDLDWDYFLETSRKGRRAAIRANKNDVSSKLGFNFFAIHDLDQSRTMLKQFLVNAQGAINWDSLLSFVKHIKHLADKSGRNMTFDSL